MTIKEIWFGLSTTNLSPHHFAYTLNSMIFWTCSVRQVLYLTPTFVSLTVSTNRLDEGLRLCLETLDNLDTNINLISTQVSIIRGPKKALPVDPGHPVDNFISRLVSSLLLSSWLLASSFKCMRVCSRNVCILYTPRRDVVR